MSETFIKFRENETLDVSSVLLIKRLKELIEAKTIYGGHILCHCFTHL